MWVGGGGFTGKGVGVVRSTPIKIKINYFNKLIIKLLSELYYSIWGVPPLLLLQSSATVVRFGEP